MSAIEPICFQQGVKPSRLSANELKILEAEYFVRICLILEKWMKKNNEVQDIRSVKGKSGELLDGNFVRCMINDMLSAGFYTVSGLALYTGVPDDVIFDLAGGLNSDPSLRLTRKLIELHRMARPEIYRKLLGKAGLPEGQE